MVKMGESKGCGKVGPKIPNDKSANSYVVSLQLSPVVSFWDCIVRTMRYSYIPEWQAIMDHAVCKPVARKVKKHGKDEFDRIKQAEKKRRRLEKALATSAAIRAELEKKKQRKLEEQRRLDEEGAAIAEAVALHVLLGEDSDDSSRIMFGGEKGLKMDLFRGERTNYVPRQSCASYAVQGIGFESNGYGLGDSSWSVPYKPFMRGAWDNKMGISADLIASQAVSSLQISENADRNAFAFNRMFRG
ncbi:unnamed protein product [Thlaspi arvense]|uniref:Uncharacterized protein n=1 Tax=Thlaspi arvense TaxID=13288 RepID=A0AAU9T1V3_THLAR|nr:unnamed protein product [Thlaspi arvense]